MRKRCTKDNERHLFSLGPQQQLYQHCRNDQHLAFSNINKIPFCERNLGRQAKNVLVSII